MDLRQVFCTFALVAGLCSIWGGVRIVLAGDEATTRPHRRFRPYNLGAGGFFVALGAGLILIVVLLTVGPWRPSEPTVYPIHVLDLRLPPAAIESGAPPAPPPAAKEPPRPAASSHRPGR